MFYLPLTIHLTSKWKYLLWGYPMCFTVKWLRDCMFSAPPSDQNILVMITFPITYLPWPYEWRAYMINVDKNNDKNKKSFANDTSGLLQDEYPARCVLWAPSKHKTFVLYLYNAGPMWKMLDRRCINVIQMFCVYWVVIQGLRCTWHKSKEKPTQRQCEQV